MHMDKGLIMKRFITVLLSVCVLSLASESALADRRPPPHRPPPPRHRHSRTSVGITFGAPLWTYPAYSPYYPYYYPYGPYYPYPPQTVVIQSTPTQYIEKNEGDSAEHYWYYCPDPKGYGKTICVFNNLIIFCSSDIYERYHVCVCTIFGYNTNE